MKINLQQHYPIADLQENMVLCSNGNWIACYGLELPEVFSLTEKDLEEIHSTWFQALRPLPVGMIVHKQDFYLKEQFDASILPTRTFLQQKTSEHFEGREFLAHRSYLFFNWPKNRLLNNPKLVNPFRKISRMNSWDPEAEFQEFRRAVQECISFLNNSRKLKVSPLPDKEILHLCGDYFNGFQKNCTTDILLDKSELRIGNNFYEGLVVNNENCFRNDLQTSRVNENYTSDEFVFHQGFMDNLGLDLRCNHIVNHILYMDDTLHWRKLLEKRIVELKKSIQFGNQNKILLERISRILDKINGEEHARMVRGHFNILYWEQNPANLEKISTRIKNQFRELEIEPHYPLGSERKNYFLNSFFCYSSNFSDEDLFVGNLKHALCLTLNCSNYRSDDDGIVLNDRKYNLPILKDVWDQHKKRIKARNFAIFAPTGEGKSFLANHILRQFFESGTRLVVIDLGGSYDKFAQLYPEDNLILRYEEGKSLGINPFYISEDPRPQQLEDLTQFLLHLGDQQHSTSKGREVAMKKVLHHFYKNGPSSHSLETFYQFIWERRNVLLENLEIHPHFFDVPEFLHIMSEYVRDGLYSYLFEDKPDQSFRLESKRLIVFELDQVKDNREILSVMLNLIKSAIQRTIWRNKEERGIILFDEFAKQLKFPNVLESVEFYYQAIRKQNGAVGIILQSINQLPENSTSASILENTQVIYSLHNEKGYEPLQRRLNLSRHDLSQLKSLRNQLVGPQKYTEIFLKIGRESNVFRLEVPPEVYAAYLTDGEENSQLMRLYAKSGSMQKAITEFVTIKN